MALNENWTGISRLPSGLKRVGFDVAALCPRNSFLAKTRYLDASLTYPVFTYTRGKIIYALMVYSLLRFKPDLIIPGDEDALMALQNLANTLDGTPLRGLSEMIRKSIAPREFDHLMLNKSRFVEKCQEWGIRVPKNVRVESLETALKLAPEFGYPLVLKFDFGYGASGVSVCRNEEDLRRGYEKYQKSDFLALLKGWIKSCFFVTQKESENSVSLQQYINGQVGQVPFCSRQGTVFSANPMIKFKTYPGETGPTSVSKGLESAEIAAAAETVAGNLRFTGFGSLDFIIDEKTQKPYVIELNPRPTPTCHFGLEFCSQDLCDAFYRGLNGHEIVTKPFKPFVVALFPNEQKRDPNSPFLKEGYHDIPQNDPELVAELVSR